MLNIALLHTFLLPYITDLSFSTHCNNFLKAGLMEHFISQQFGNEYLGVGFKTPPVSAIKSLFLSKCFN